MKYGELTVQKSPRWVYQASPYNHNSAKVAALPVEVTGYVLLDTMIRRCGYKTFDGLRILDFGCGSRFGQTIWNLNLPVGLYLGIDQNDKAITWCRENLVAERMAFHRINMRNKGYNPKGEWPSPGYIVDLGHRNFDIASMFSVITHQQPDEADLVFRMLYEAVRPGGKMYFTAFLDPATRDYREGDETKPGHMSTYNPDFLISIVEAAGWTLIEAHEPGPLNATAFICRRRDDRPLWKRVVGV
ncbi:MAG: methyltransferase domain-containing protein [Parvibaculum sp.]|uniref:class I SAM-dependent methyltransferase n=1 Tax=Parvibaculum sp. TaxID=2024848 RepID=UPI0027286D44|nr:methyltransferase domain-containing protein [Parvibaculum sp.]MDO8839050.1 methyltransferase domain-containing protein [Parvibaculum sp.]